MRVEMTNKRFTGAAKVLPDDVPTWEAAGWVATPEKKTPSKKGKEQ